MSKVINADMQSTSAELPVLVMKQDYRWATPRLAFFNLVLMEFGDFAMERRMLKRIKSRAEGLRPQTSSAGRDGGAGEQAGPSTDPVATSPRVGGA